MDYVFEKAWQETMKMIEGRFGEKLDYSAIIFIIGLQELGKDYQSYKKDQKLEIMHIGVCSLLAPYGYYEFEGRDEEGWPHFKRTEALPSLNPNEQEMLMKRAIVDYFSPEM